MKKKYLVIGIIFAVAVVWSIWFIGKPKTLGNMNHIYKTPETSTASFAFPAKAGDQIKVSFASTVEQGTLDISIYDSKGNVIEELANARELETFFYFDHADTYTLVADCKDFIGKFKIFIYEWR